MKNPLTGNKYSKQYYDIKKKLDKKDLPMNNEKIKKKFFSLLDKNDIIILEAQTGAGKSVVMPPFLLMDYLIKKKKKKIEDIKGIMVTQPRTLNAKNIASFVANILDVPIGSQVGYRYRHNNLTSKDTILSYVTDGSLVQELYHNGGVFDYDIVIIDEVHERSLSIDILLMMIKNYIKNKMGKCKFVITSATLDKEMLHKYYFGIGKIGDLDVEGRAFPVTINYLDEPVKKYDKKLMEIVENILTKTKSGDILVFLEAKSQIDKLCHLMNKDLGEKYKLICLKLYSGIDKEDEELATDGEKFKKLKGNPKRKIVLSTNVAESGVTVDGILFVIDTGLRYEMVYKNRISNLNAEFISKDSAEQRAGRAGRTQPGTCYRLFTEEQYKNFDEHKSPEILVSNIDDIIINLLGTQFIGDVSNLNCFFSGMITQPNVQQVNDSLKYLFELGIIKDKCKLMDEYAKTCKMKKNNETCFTFIGECIHKLPLEPALALALLASYNYGVTDDVLIIVSMLSVENKVSKWFLKPSRFDKDKLKKYNKIMKKYSNTKSDLFILLKLYNQFQKTKNRKKWAYDNFIRLSFLYNTEKNMKVIRNKFEKLNKSCYIEQIAKGKFNHEENIINSFMHGFFNQLAIQSKYNKTVYNKLIMPKKRGIEDIELKPMKNNNLEKISKLIAFIGQANINDNDTLNGLININKKTLDALYDIQPKYFNKEKILI